jgi:hypothetical protein
MNAKMDTRMDVKIKNKERLQLTKLMFSSNDETSYDSNTTHANNNLSNPDMNKIRIGGKGRTGSRDPTRGKCTFTRPCTVGWKSQNQPLTRGGGNRTPL